MLSLLCLYLPGEFQTQIKVQFPEIYISSTFSDCFIPPEGYDVILLPVEQFIYQSRRLISCRTITFGRAEYLEEAFLLGAADYLKEPWDCRELQIRMNHITAPILLRNRDYTVQVKDAGVVINGRIHELNRREVKILSLLGYNRNTAVSYNTLSHYVGIQSSAYENTLYVTISRLRKKLFHIDPDVFPGQVNIKSISGEGYILISSCG